MSSSSILSTNKGTESDTQRASTLKNTGSQNKRDIGANIVLIGAPGSGKCLGFFS